MFIEIPVFNAYSVDPDQTPLYAASDLGRRCLPMSLLWNARHILVKCFPLQIKGQKGPSK